MDSGWNMWDTYQFDDRAIITNRVTMDHTRSTDPILSEEIRQAVERALQGVIVPYEEVFPEEAKNNESD